MLKDRPCVVPSAEISSLTPVSNSRAGDRQVLIANVSFVLFRDLCHALPNNSSDYFPDSYWADFTVTLRRLARIGTIVAGSMYSVHNRLIRVARVSHKLDPDLT